MNFKNAFIKIITTKPIPIATTICAVVLFAIQDIKSKSIPNFSLTKNKMSINNPNITRKLTNSFFIANRIVMYI